jgi:hypothetical protein
MTVSDFISHTPFKLPLFFILPLPFPLLFLLSPRAPASMRKYANQFLIDGQYFTWFVDARRWAGRAGQGTSGQPLLRISYVLYLTLGYNNIYSLSYSEGESDIARGLLAPAGGGGRSSDSAV